MKKFIAIAFLASLAVSCSKKHNTPIDIPLGKTVKEERPSTESSTSFAQVDYKSSVKEVINSPEMKERFSDYRTERLELLLEDDKVTLAEIDADFAGHVNYELEKVLPSGKVDYIGIKLNSEEEIEMITLKMEEDDTEYMYTASDLEEKEEL